MIVVDDAELIREVYRRAWLVRIDQAADRMFAGHPDLDVDKDCTVLTFEDMEELKFLDCEIGIEHLSGWHRRQGCPPGCMYRGV